MTQRSRTAAVWILRIEDQPNGPMVTVTSRSDLVAPGVDSSTRYRDLESAIATIKKSAAQFVRRCDSASEG
jgi:hypothetical protein